MGDTTSEVGPHLWALPSPTKLNLWKAADRVPLVPGDDGGIDAERRPFRPFCLHVCGSLFLSPTQDAMPALSPLSCIWS